MVLVWSSTQPTFTCSKSTMERLKLISSDVCLSLTLNRFHIFFSCFHCWLWASKHLLGTSNLKYWKPLNGILTLSWQSPLSRNQSIYLLCKSIDWFLYDRDLLRERVKGHEMHFCHIFQVYFTGSLQANLKVVRKFYFCFSDLKRSLRK